MQHAHICAPHAAHRYFFTAITHPLRSALPLVMLSMPLCNCASNDNTASSAQWNHADYMASEMPGHSIYIGCLDIDAC